MLVDTVGGRTVRRNAEVRTRSSAPNSRAKLVVVVDDEPSIQEVVSMILESEGGYEVRCASNGEEALALLDQIAPPDLLVVDIMMPVMDGWGLLTALRHNEKTARIPVIVSSASSKHDATSLGVARVLPKPIDYDAFLAAVDELTHGRERQTLDAE
ncbi:response regulator [Sorangium sp. So ce1099]|uniref:response regulator n=1 Tax=Sorangium sp. So ce1099 TaxID=3133331 RepID=UPI003EFF3F00